MTETQHAQTARAIAERIVQKQFRNGSGDEADRLVLMTRDGRDLGGWGRGPFADRVEQIIADALAHGAEGSEQPCPNCGSEDRDHRGILRCRCPDRVPAPPAAPEVTNLFRSGEFSLHSGERSSWKIDCDALSEADWVTLAALVADLVGPFSAVEGVPTGGDALARHLQPYAAADGPLLIVDDVLTTAGSIEAHRAGRHAIGAVVFARGSVPSWVRSLFVVTVSPAATEALRECASRYLSFNNPTDADIRRTNELAEKFGWK